MYQGVVIFYMFNINSYQTQTCLSKLANVHSSVSSLSFVTDNLGRYTLFIIQEKDINFGFGRIKLFRI